MTKEVSQFHLYIFSSFRNTETSIFFPALIRGGKYNYITMTSISYYSNTMSAKVLISLLKQKKMITFAFSNIFQFN